MFFVERPQFLVMGEMLQDQFFVSSLHTPSVTNAGRAFAADFTAASGGRIYIGSSVAGSAISPRDIMDAPIAATHGPRSENFDVSSTATTWPLGLNRAAASFALTSPAKTTSPATREAISSSTTSNSSDTFSNPSDTTR